MKYPSIEMLEDLPVDERNMLLKHPYIFEKLDGGNVQVAVSGDTVTHGLRSGHLEGARAPWVEDFKKWYWTNHVKISELPDGVYFGEFLAPHTISYKPEFVNNFFLIDVFTDEKFLDYKVGMGRVQNHGLAAVMKPAPILHEGEATMQMIEELVNGKSEFSIDGAREGVVIKDYDTQKFAKAKHPKFKSNLSLEGE